MVTLTAPGVEQLPWDRERCRHRPETPCSGKRGCKVQDRALREWCDTAALRWGMVRRAAAQATKRRTGEAPFLVHRAWEPQKRGAPHLHLVLAAGRPVDRHTAAVFAEELTRLAPDYGFGPQTHVGKPQSGASAAKYIASYLTGRRSKPTVRENIADPRLPKSLLWLSPKCALITGLTMRRLRVVRWVRAARRGLCEFPAIPSRRERARVQLAYLLVYRT